jgi:hypothetical protein
MQLKVAWNRLLLAAALAASAAAGASAQQAAPAPGSVIDYGDGVNLVIVTQVPLGPNEFAAMREFSGFADYFGAFAVDPGAGDSFYWVAGYQSQALAMQIAYEGCMESRPQSGDCVLHARLDPVDYLPRLGRAVELGAPASRNWRGFYLGGSLPGRWQAYAMSDLTSGAAVDNATEEEARSTALAECEDAAAGAMRVMTPATSGIVRKGGHNACRVVDLRRP